MSDKTFALAMGKIINEVKAKEQEDIEHGIRMERRAYIFGCARGIFVFLFLVTLAYYAYAYRDDLASYYNPNSDDQMVGMSANPIQRARQDAAYRDKVVDDLGK
jgi:hypothetical protein